jgi:splicing factor 3B subunit 2
VVWCGVVWRLAVSVPKHWCMKRKYLQGKRGIEKPPFQLPQCIADTGITKVRGAMEEKAAAKGAKGKARDKVQVKMGMCARPISACALCALCCR